MHTSRPVPFSRHLGRLLTAVLLVFVLPFAAQAQCRTLADGAVFCDDGGGPGDGRGVDGEPLIAITTPSLRTSQPVMPSITIAASDDRGLIASTFRVFVNGVDATSGFTVTTTTDEGGVARSHLRASGSVRLSEAGPVTVTARVCDNATSQQCTDAEPATYVLALPGVTVGPDNVSTGAPASWSVAFQVSNTGTETATYDLVARCTDVRTGQAHACTAEQSSVTLSRGGQVSVRVGYAGTPHPTGTTVVAKLEATQRDASGVQDAGWVHVVREEAAGAAQLAAQVSLVDLNTGATTDRGSCVTVAIAPRGAYECGDLRVVHALPVHLSRGRGWAPTLVYNSQQAAPRPTVYADITLPAGSERPGWVQVLVRMADGTTHAAGIPTVDYVPGIPRRVAVQWDGLQTPTGAYSFTLEVLHHFGPKVVSSGAVPGVVSIVNRSGSLLGAGWWLAGWEQLCIGCGTAGGMLWVGGDGSTRLYRQSAAGAPWVAAMPDGPPDTLVVPATGGFERRIRGGGTVHFDAAGRHRQTRNRLGQSTVFNVNNGGYLLSIQVPGPGGVYPTWTFVYSGSLARIEAALLPNGAVRTVGLAYAQGGRRITGITDPDGVGVGFRYDGGTARITAQRDRRGSWTEYTYGPAFKLAEARLLMHGTAQSADDVIRGFGPAEGRSVTQAGHNGPFMDAAVNAFTVLDGPRGDVDDRAALWLTDRGAPYRIVDALGGETLLRRGDGRFPGLVTEVLSAGGRTTAQYDARGRVHTSTVHNPRGSGEDHVTTYAWDDKWEAPTRISAPGSAPVHRGYDAANGNLLWERLGDDPARQVNFHYYPTGHPHAGQPRSAHAPSGVPGVLARDSLVYDARGNLKMSVSPLGFTTLYVRDALGRDSITYTPVEDDETARDTVQLKRHGARHVTLYDAMGRVRSTESIGPARSYTAVHQGFAPQATLQEHLAVATTYDNEGAPLTVTRTSTPNHGGGVLETEYEYDAAGRRVREASSQAGTQTFTHDPAGNVTVARTAMGKEILMRYDALGRLTRRTVPERVYSRACDGIALNLSCEPFPRFPNHGDGYKVNEEWSHYRYDQAGRQVYAENADAIVQRTYYPGGALRTDSTWIRGAEGMDYTAYGLTYAYDAALRLSSMSHPANLASTAALDQFFYHPVTGALSTGRSRLGHEFAFRHNLAGQMTSMAIPGQIVDSMHYDLEGRLTSRYESGPYAGVLHAEAIQYDARGKLLQARNGDSQFTNWYSGLGSLVGNDWFSLEQNGRIAEELRTDPLGSTALRITSIGTGNTPGEFPRYESFFGASTGRLVAIRRVPPATPGSDFSQDSTAQRYDTGGNVISTYQRRARAGSDGGVELGSEVETRSYYGADDRLRAFQKMDVRRTDDTNHEDAGVWEEYRYDALGRRVLVRTRTDGGLCNFEAWACTASVTRFVWAGDQLLWELKSAPGAAGGNVSYFHTGGIDRPLVITKDGTSVIPHQNWRGQFARGTYANGTRSDCTSYPANGCTPIQWPGERTTARHELDADGRIQNWFGGLVDGMRDASGQMYMRNRYYDPRSGQFTQSDPIGLAGGLNSYGFAAGDPVSYSDPYGLKVCFQGTAAQVRAFRSAAEEATGAAVWLDKQNCVSRVGNAMDSGRKALRDRLNTLAGLDNLVYNVSFGTRGSGDDVRALSGTGAVSQSRINRHCPALVCPVNIRIGSGWATGYQSTELLGMCMPWNSSPNTLAHTFTHEVLGHGFEYYALGAAAAQTRREIATIRGADNVYLAATNQAPRCGH